VCTASAKEKEKKSAKRSKTTFCHEKQKSEVRVKSYLAIGTIQDYNLNNVSRSGQELVPVLAFLL